MHAAAALFQVGSEPGQTQHCLGHSASRNPTGFLRSAQPPCLPLGLFCSLQSLQRRATALPCPCPGRPALAPRSSPCVLVAAFPPSQLVPAFPCPDSYHIDRGRRQICAHHLSQARASLTCRSSVSGEAVRGLFLRNKNNYRVFSHHHYNLSTFLV